MIQATRHTPFRPFPVAGGPGARRNFLVPSLLLLALVGLPAVGRAGAPEEPLRTSFQPETVRVEPRGSDGTPAWACGWRTTRWGRAGKLAPVAPARGGPRSEGGRVVYARDGFDEWYETRPEGLEQGFTLPARPPGSGPLVIAGRLEGGLAACLTPDAAGVDLLHASGAQVLHVGGLHAYGADRRELPARFELLGEELALVVDDAGARYPVTIDPLLSAPSWTGEPNQVNASFGVSSACAGDVNGDGYSDVIVGAWNYSNGEASEGRAYLYLGTAAGLSLAPAWTAESNQVGAAFGYSVSTAGDVNGDGFSDVIVGAFRYDNGETDEGRVYVYLGSAAGLSPTAAWTAESNQAGSAYGLSVSTAGDVNGDGYSDVIVGALAYDNGETNEGRAFVYQGSATGLAAAPAWTAESNQASSEYGCSVSLAGDVNGDGFSDVIVGANWYDNGESNEGRAYVYHGSATGLGATPAWSAESNQALAEFGTAVAGAGDVNGDGFSDVIVGATNYDNGQTNEGRAFAYYGSAGGLAATAGWFAEGNQTNARFGFRLGTAGDVNGDGCADVIVGAYEYDSVETQEGRAFVFEGGTTGLNTAPAWINEPNQNDARYGISVATAGDVNGDGFSEIVVGADQFDNGEFNEGRAFLYLGSGNTPSLLPAWTAESNQADAGLGGSVASAGDVNGDGYDDVIVGAGNFDGALTDAGRALVYYGAAAGPSTTPSWTVDGTQAGARFGWCVASAGDVNGDGYADVLVSAPRYENGESNEGRAYLYPGSAAGLSTTPAWTAESNRVSGRFGQSLAAAGDVNGDGYGDVIVGVPYYNSGYFAIGEACLYLGSAAGLSPTPAWTSPSHTGETEFGYSVACAGDVNGDGFSDVIIGEPLYRNGTGAAGRALAYYGSATGLPAFPSWTFDGLKTESWFGSSVAGAGDLNGDGYGDVVVGAPFYFGVDSTGTGPFVFFGSAAGLGGGIGWTTPQPQGHASFGFSVASAGDVNADGYADLLVGAPRYDALSTDNGRAMLCLGSALGPVAPQAWGVQGFQSGAQLGFCVASAGDVNGDGYADVICGAPSDFNGQSREGRASVYCGNDGAGRAVLPRQCRTDGMPIAALGRSNSPTEFQVRADLPSAFGRTRLTAVHEVKPRGVPFSGLGVVTGPATDTGADGQLETIRPVDGLTADTQYHWRIRACYDMVKTPYQRYGPWLQPPHDGWNVPDVRTALDASGVAELPPPDGAIARLAPVTPNPVRGAARLGYALGRRGPVRLALFDVRGREVSLLVDAVQEAGEYAASWSGTGRHGEPLAAGVYFARLRVGNETRSEKLILAR